MLKVGTTFSGIGATEQALKNLGIQHEVAWACDVDKYAKQTYLANHKCDVFYDDIRNLDIPNLEKVDLYVFGFPCQDVSIAGKKDLSIGRTKLVQYSLDILKELRPKYFIFENVKGLLSPKNKEFFDDIIAQIESIGYHVTYKVLNTLHFNIPQNRERVYCVGSLDKRINISVLKIPTSNRISSILDIRCTSDIKINHKFYTMNGRVKKSYIQYDRNGKKQNSASDRVYFQDSYCPTLTTKMDSPMIILSDWRPSLLHNSRIRPLSVLEKTRLQGFSDTFHFPVSKSQAMKQLGNSMTVNVVEHVIRCILEGSSSI